MAKKKCDACKGGGLCRVCKGSGKKGSWVTTKCSACSGSGKQPLRWLR
jgi:hypothetical protein